MMPAVLPLSIPYLKARYQVTALTPKLFRALELLVMRDLEIDPRQYQLTFDLDKGFRITRRVSERAQ